jgi:2-polyprenyl-6-methoxyphenol hydroxylase-like FAD-dependent oxidoreductase
MLIYFSQSCTCVEGGELTATVLVVGAGPTGLTMAIELARRGVDVAIIDASEGPAVETRALGVQARTLELFGKIDVEMLLSPTGFRSRRSACSAKTSGSCM